MRAKLHPIFDQLRSKSKKDIDELAKTTHQEVFKRTDCLSCGNCCKSAPPIVTKFDIKRIASFLGESPRTILRKHVIQDIDGELSFHTVPCSFLGADNYCSIYEARPEACRDYPHTDSGQFTARRKLHSLNQAICPAVDEILTIMEQKIKEDQ